VECGFSGRFPRISTPNSSLCCCCDDVYGFLARLFSSTGFGQLAPVIWLTVAVVLSLPLFSPVSARHTFLWFLFRIFCVRRHTFPDVRIHRVPTCRRPLLILWPARCSAGWLVAWFPIFFFLFVCGRSKIFRFFVSTRGSSRVLSGAERCFFLYSFFAFGITVERSSSCFLRHHFIGVPL